MGIAMCHFALTAADAGADVSFVIEDPGISAPQDVEYMASFVVNN